MLPDFIGLGANRSGSTWLAQNLMEHPGLCLPPQKELLFFNRHYDEGIAYYEAQFASCQTDKIIGEVTAAYFGTEEVAARIHKHVPNARLFVSLRDPISRAYSQYWRNVAVGKIEEGETFEDALHRHEWILWAGLSYEHLTRYYQYFDKNSIRVIFFDDIENSPAQVLSGLFEFLGVDPEFESVLVDRRINAAASIQGLARSRATWHLNRLLNRLRFHSLSRTVEQKNRSTLPPMTTEARQILIDYYRDDVNRLQELLQRDLQSWLALEPAQSN